MPKPAFLSVLAIAFLLAPPSAFADVHIRATSFGTRGQDVRIQGQKQVVETRLPAGTLRVVTRADLGVEWTIDPELKIYEERPLAVAYASARKIDPYADGHSSFVESAPFSGAAGDCVPSVRPVEAAKEFAGVRASGYQLSCGSEPGTGWIWVSSPGALPQAVEREMAEFEAAHFAAAYKEYPEQLKNAAARGSQVFRDLAEAFSTKTAEMRAPDGVPLALEAALPAEEGRESSQVLLFQIWSIESAPADPALFEVPKGFRRVDNLASERSAMLLGVRS